MTYGELEDAIRSFAGGLAPNRDRPHPMDDAVEAGDRCLRHHVQ
jgi:hypothetical protein